jgi:hypothetical protein
MPAARAELGNLRAITRSFRPISQQYGNGDLARIPGRRHRPLSWPVVTG